MSTSSKAASKVALSVTLPIKISIRSSKYSGILRTIDKIAPVGSILACSEPWGDFYHRECWNIRPPEWWSDTLADWEFEFYNDYMLTDPPGRSKGFIATKL